MTLFGWTIVFGASALIGLMGWLGRRKRWLIASGLTAPFFALLAYFEVTTVGPPIYEDPYGPMLAAMILGPISIGWIAFLIGRISVSKYSKIFMEVKAR